MMRGEAASDTRPRRMSRRTKMVIAIALGSVVLVLAVAPFTLMTIPDPHPYRLDSLASEQSGTFVTVRDGYYKLYPYAAPLLSFPSDALVADNARPTVVVKYRQSENPDLYAIHSYTSNQPVAVEKSLTGGTTLELTPEQPLPPGQYVITAPRDSVDEGIDNFYFQVPG
jgi:hypothetical protein